MQSKESTLRSNNKVRCSLRTAREQALTNVWYQILRDELRKLQSGVLLSEKQRNPGVGYFSSYSMSQPSTSTLNLSSPGGSDGSRTPPATRMGSMTAISESERKRQSTSTPVIQRTDSVASERAGPDEALNFEYLRNVLLEFLEKPAMRVSFLCSSSTLVLTLGCRSPNYLESWESFCISRRRSCDDWQRNRCNVNFIFLYFVAFLFCSSYFWCLDERSLRTGRRPSNPNDKVPSATNFIFFRIEQL